ncbi:hypothetical protein ACEQ8H_001812 [Pleosporales sp. CAS-2024a]
MFSADLSWGGPDTETVGERRERKARERASTAGSIKTSTSSRSSVVADRDLWWTSGLKKAKSIKSNYLRPSSEHSSTSQATAQSAKKGKLGLQTPDSFENPTLQPEWTYTAPFDSAIDEVPELDGDSSSQRTNSTETPQERRWAVRTPVHVDSIEEGSQLDARVSGSLDHGKGQGSIFASDADDLLATPTSQTSSKSKAKSRPSPIVIDRSMEFETVQIHATREDASASAGTGRPSIMDHYSNGRAIACPPFSQWETLTPRGAPQRMHIEPKPSNKVAAAHGNLLELNRFQKFIRRMENAGSKIVLDRLSEEWHEGADQEADEQLDLEKQLWLLTGFQMQSVGTAKVTPKPSCDTGRVLDLYGNLSEVFQMSAIYPQQTVHFLTNKSKSHVTLPANVSYLTARDCGAVPLPYPENYFSHIRATTLPSLVPSSKMPDLFRECYKLLAPGGLMEIGIMDASPVRTTSGPLLQSWIEDRMSTNIERQFRCSKPCSLVPVWLADAGFDLSDADGNTSVTLPCAVDDSSATVDAKLSAVVGRAMWRDAWGSFIDSTAGESRWWWDEENIVQECLERQTNFQFRVIFAYRR